MRATGGPQSILISGESGAGKTESAKLCLTCLAQLSASPDSVTTTALESGLLLESFGNARTVYNDNSSRLQQWVTCILTSAIASARAESVRTSESLASSIGRREAVIVFNYLLAANLSEADRDSFWAAGGLDGVKPFHTPPPVPQVAAATRAQRQPVALWAEHGDHPQARR